MLVAAGFYMYANSQFCKFPNISKEDANDREALVNGHRTSAWAMCPILPYII